MTRIISIGECMVEMAPLSAQGTYKLGFAGDTMNTAWYLRGLVAAADQVDYLTALGTDSASDQMIAFLAEAGIGTYHIMRRPDLTVGLYMIQLKDGERSFSYWRGQSAARTLAADGPALAQALAGADYAYLSGITLAILPAQDRQNLLGALTNLRQAGGTIVFDPNLRPRLWPTSDEMTESIMQAAAVSDIVLPSYEDEAAWFDDADIAATASRYVDAGAGTVIVKNGPDEILAIANGVSTQHKPQLVTQVVDTTSAGDAFNAGFLAAHIAGKSLAAAVDQGARLAAQVVQARGALVACTL